MALKDWLRSNREAEERDYTPDELMALERYDEAKAKLVERLRYHPKDLNAHLKLAEAYRLLDQPDSCRQEFLYVARAFTEDGFYDKARAVLTRLSRFFPDQIDVEQKMAALQRAKRLDQERDRARRGLLSHGRPEDTRTGRLTVEFEQVWQRLSSTTLVDRLSSQDVTHLFENVRVRRMGSGTVVAETGPEPEALFIVVAGSLEARCADANGHTITLRSFGPGEIVGEAVLFEHRDWPAEYRCDGTTMVLELSRRGLERLIERHTDPRRLLDILQGQGNDRRAVRALEHLVS